MVTKIKLHGHLGDAIGKDWKLAVKSVKEAIHAINTITKGKLYRYLLKKDSEGAQYKILINETPVSHSVNKIDSKNWEEAKKTELVMEIKNLKSIDIVPIIEGADSDFLSVLLVIVGVVLIVVGLLTGGVLTAVGVTLVIGGITMLLSRPPEIPKPDDIQNIGGGRSYFFNGAVNITTEGGPVPLGYGECIIGSQVLSQGFGVGIRTDSLPRWEYPETVLYPIT